jgi:hypothetical protein
MNISLSVFLVNNSEAIKNSFVPGAAPHYFTIVITSLMVSPLVSSFLATIDSTDVVDISWNNTILLT